MKNIITLALALVMVLDTYAENKVYTLEIRDFSEMTVANSINVTYKSVPDSAGIATFMCDPSQADLIVFSNDKGKLKIQSQADSPSTPLPHITVYSTALTKATNWGDSTIVIDTNAPGTKFKAKVIGNGHIEAHNLRFTQVEGAVEAGNGHVYLDGKAQQAKYTIVSAGTVAAGNLEASEVKCVMLGTGSVDCYATTKLSVIAAGSGKVYYRGNPVIKKNGIGVELVPIE